MILNQVKPAHAVTFMKNLSPEMVTNELEKTIHKIICKYSFFCLIYYCLMQRFLKFITRKLNSITKTAIILFFY